jgi:putative DNA primase/helicase
MNSAGKIAPAPALELARHGFHVLPVQPGKKTPAVKGEADGPRWGATNGTAELADLFSRPELNLGISCGPSNLVVLDLDVKGDANGVAWLDEKIARHGALPNTIEAETPSGGRHIYFAAPDFPVSNSAGKIAPGVDIRADGGYVVAPPSVIHADGLSTTYEWKNPPGLFEAAPLPDWLVDLLRPPLPLSQLAAPSRPDFGNSIIFGDEKASPAEVEDILDHINPDIGYQDWCNVLMGLHAHFQGSEQGLSIAEAWSARGTKYKTGEVAAKWKGFTPGGGISFGTVCELARSDGADLSAITRKHRGGVSQPARSPRLRGGLQMKRDTVVTPLDIDPDPGEIELSEDGVALAFTEKHGDFLLFDHDAGHWVEWQGDHWKSERTGKAFNYCRELSREASNTEASNKRGKLRSASFANGVERMARTDPTHATRQEDWDADPWLLGCPGITVNLKTGESYDPRPLDRITKQTAAAPAETASCPLWLAFLDDATGGDTDMIGFLKRWSGYSLTGDTREHALIFIFGPGGNGKSVFLNTVSGIAGGYAATSAMETFAASSGDRHPTDLAMLRGARMVTASETEEGRAWAESRIKQLTGGDPITARFMRRDFFTYQPGFKLTIVGNHQPVLQNVDDAARRRFNIVAFTSKPANPDKLLEDKLRAEWPGILRWMIDGCLEWQEHGLVRPASVTAATDAYFDAQDLVGQWLDEHCTLEPGNQHRWEASQELFKDWKAYAEAAGEKPGTNKSLAGHLQRRGLLAKNKKVGNKSYRSWLGVTLNRQDVHHD